MWGHKALTNRGSYTGDDRILNAAFIGSLVGGRMILEFLGIALDQGASQLVKPNHRSTDVSIEDLAGDFVDLNKLDSKTKDILAGYIKIAHKAGAHMTKPEDRDLTLYDKGIPLIDSLLEQQLKTLRPV